MAADKLISLYGFFPRPEPETGGVRSRPITEPFG